MQLRTTKTTFFPQKIQNKQNICLFQEFCVPPGTCLRTTSGTRTTGWEPPDLNILEKLTFPFNYLDKSKAITLSSLKL
jgi:hypothetical protein